MIDELRTKNNEFENIKRIRQLRALNRLFSSNQIEILLKISRFEKLSKTQNEYYSRIIKPKINAIIDMYEFALLFRDKI
jgi:Txe/YoeB family toxin of Txe-Axe toxin-antitoxin module